MIYLEAHDGHIVIPECPTCHGELVVPQLDQDRWEIPAGTCADRNHGLALAEGDHVGIVEQSDARCPNCHASYSLPLGMTCDFHFPVRPHRFVGVGIVGKLIPVIDALDVKMTDEDRVFVARSLKPPNGLWDGTDWHDIDLDVKPGDTVAPIEILPNINQHPASAFGYQDGYLLDLDRLGQLWLDGDVTTTPRLGALGILDGTKFTVMP